MDDNKFSLERMLELSMGLAMSHTFSRAIDSAMTPSVHAMNNQTNMPVRYLYAIINGRQEGPYTNGEVLGMVREGIITDQTYMWKAGMPQWCQAKDFSDLDVSEPMSPPTMFSK